MSLRKWYSMFPYFESWNKNLNLFFFFFQLFFTFYFLGTLDDFRLCINVCAICCFDSGFRNARQAFRGCGGTVKDMSHSPDISSWRVLCMWSCFFKIYFWNSFWLFIWPWLLFLFLFFLLFSSNYLHPGSSSVVWFVILEPFTDTKELSHCYFVKLLTTQYLWKINYFCKIKWFYVYYHCFCFGCHH